MKKIKMLLLICSCLVAFSSAFADTVTNLQRHKNWYSMLYTTSSGIKGRIATAPELSTDIFTFDLFRDDKNPDVTSWTFFISTMKQNGDKGWISVKTPVELSCALRVDSKTVYSTSCKFFDDEEKTYLTFDTSYIPRQFITECAEGANLRVKFNMDNKDYFDRFSLSGFTSALNRANILFKANNDSAYFDKSKNPSVKSDASYFDI